MLKLLILFIFPIAIFPQGLQQVRKERQSEINANNQTLRERSERERRKQELKEALGEIYPEYRLDYTKSKFKFSMKNDSVYKANSQYFIKAFNELNRMLRGDTILDFTRAVYLVENALLENKLPYIKFIKAIDQKVSIVKSYLKQKGIADTTSDAINFGVQKLFQDTLAIKQANGSFKHYKPFKYDFKDYKGEKDITKLTVSKLLFKGTGNCASLPRLYQILVNRLGGESYIAYSPEHSYIKFKNASGNWYNFETTNGCLTTDAFITGSGFIKSEALKAEIYTRPTDLRELVAGLFVDLAQYYLHKFGYDNFQEMCAEKCLQYNSRNVMAYMIRSNYYTAQFDLYAANDGYPKQDQLINYPETNKLYLKRNSLYDQLDNLGYSSIPKDAYVKWLASLKQQERKQESEELQKNFSNRVNGFKKWNWN